MKKKMKLPLLVMVLSLMLVVTSSALPIMPRWDVTSYCNSALSFTGTTANCTASIRADTGAKIEGTMTLYRVSGSSQYYVNSWSLSGTTRVYTTETCSATSGQTYKLVVDVTVTGSNGSDNITVDTTERCD